MLLPGTAEPQFAGLGPYSVLGRGRRAVIKKKNENFETKLSIKVNICLE